MKNVVWLASYPKSGNTWFRMFLSNLNSSDGAIKHLNEISKDGIASAAMLFEDELALNPYELFDRELELYRPDVYRSFFQNEVRLNKIQYIKVHDAYILNSNKEPIFPADISKCSLYFVRNPHDVCVSYANHGGSAIDVTYRALLNKNFTTRSKIRGQIQQKYLSWGLHYRSWTKQTEIPVKVIRYEDMLSDPYNVFADAVKFIELDYDLERIKRAVDNSSFDKLKKMEQTDGFIEKTAKAKSFFWKGEAGYYKNYLTKEQIDIITDNFRDEMEELGYIKDNKLTF